MEQIKIDVVIPTYHPGEEFLRLVSRLEKQKYPVHCIHVINTETGEFPAEVLEKYENITVTHISPQQFDHGATRDMGARMSKAEIVLFMTQDAVPADDELTASIINAFEDPEVGIAYGRQLPAKDCRIIERYTRSFNYPKDSKVKQKDDLPQMGIKTYFCSDVCAAYRKSIYESLGGFIDHTIFNEDMIMAGQEIQAGYKVAYVAEARVIHSHNYGCIQQMRRNFDLAVSQMDHPEIFEGIRSEDEGIRLVKKTAVYLFHIKKPWLVAELVIKSGFKYLGYRLGRRYQSLPQWLVLKLTMNPRYWDKPPKKYV